MSKRNGQRKSTFKRDPSVGDDDTNRRRPCYQLIEKEKQRKILGLNDDRITQLGILHDILGNIKLNRTIQNEKNSKTRPISAKNFNQESLIIENEPVRLNRSSRKVDRQIRTTRSTSLYSPSRPGHNISLTSNNSTSQELKHLLTRLSTEFHDLESVTGFKSNTNCTSLTTALLRLTDHVKQCNSNSKEINNLKDQLSIVIKTQLDFQDKIENQITNLQTMMQMICQLVNNEIVSKKNSKQDSEISQSYENWLNNAQKPYLIPKDTTNAMNELLLFTRKMNNVTPIDNNLFDNYHSIFHETLEASKKLIPSTLSMSTNEINENDNLKQIQQRRNFDQELHSSMISPINISSSIFRNETSTNIPSTSTSETILEKILQERLRLVQQMAELTKQHDMTQEELANLEIKTKQTQEI